MPVADRLALSLSCIALFNFLHGDAHHTMRYPPDADMRQETENLLLRLERDLASSYYFCLSGLKAHAFFPLPGPADYSQLCDKAALLP